METLEFVAVSIVSVAVLAAVLGAILAFRRRMLPSPDTGVSPTVGHRAVAVLDAERADADAPAVQRLVREAAARVFRMMPAAVEVEVRSGAGAVLGVVERTPPPAQRVLLPDVLFEPHARPSRGPDISGHLSEPEEGEPPGSLPLVAPTFSLPASPPAPPLADRFDLTREVRRRVRDPDDPVDVIRAILQAADIDARVEGDLLRAGEEAIIVIDPPGYVVRREMLNQAFIRIEQSGAERGLVIALGILDVADVRRREALAPHVLHVGRQAIQRMADAVAIGANPVRFAAAPALTVMTRGSDLPARVA